MSAFDLFLFVMDIAREMQIPEVKIPAVVDRAACAELTRVKAGKNRPLVGSGTQSGLVLVASLDGVEREVQGATEAAQRALARRVVQRAAEDHRRGLLERRCA